MRFELVAVLILAFAVHVNCYFWGLLGRGNAIDNALANEFNSTTKPANAVQTLTDPSKDSKLIPPPPAQQMPPPLEPTPSPSPLVKSAMVSPTSGATPSSVESSKSPSDNANNLAVSTASKDKEVLSGVNDTVDSSSEPDDSKNGALPQLSSSTVESSDSDDKISKDPIRPRNNEDGQSENKSMPTWKKVTIGLVIAAGSVVVLIIICSIVKTMRGNSDN